MPARRIFPSRIDGALVLLALGPLPAAWRWSARLPAACRTSRDAASSSRCSVGSILVVAWVLLSTRYTLDVTSLGVRSGPFSWVIPLQDIRAITAPATRAPRRRFRCSACGSTTATVAPS